MQFDAQGFYPPCACVSCGVPLDDTYRPAERYAGTYTGLCDCCARAAPHRIRTSALDGLETWDYPPHCPAWRRDREIYFAYSDCTACAKAPGTKWVSRSDAQGGPYRAQCKLCADRRDAHPERMRYYMRRKLIFESADARLNKSLLAAGLVRRQKAGRTWRLERAPGVAIEQLARVTNVVAQRCRSVQEHWDRVSPGADLS